MQFKIPKFGFKFKKRGNAAGFFGAKLSIISNHLSIINDKLFQNNHLSIISNKLSQNNHLSIINDKLSKKRINYKLSIFGKKIFINYKLLIAVGVLALAGVGGTLALNGFFGGGGAIPEDTMTRGLVGYWSFDEGGGQTAFDASGSGNDGTLGATVAGGTDDPKWTEGQNGGALAFDGKNDYVNAGNDASLNMGANQDFTIGAWVKYSNNPSYHTIAGKYCDINTAGYWLDVLGNKIRLRVSDGGGSYVDTTTTANYNDNKWHHIMAIADRDGLAYIYIDGNQVKSNDISSENGDTGSGALSIGRPGGSIYTYFNGQIDEVKIYNRALTEAEVKYHYNRGGPVAQWDMDEGSGLVVKDGSGNGNDGTISGAAWTQGKHGSALSFDGAGDYVSTNSSDSLNLSTNNFSIGAWVKHPPSDAAVSERIVHKSDGTQGYYLVWNPSTKRFEISVSGYFLGPYFQLDDNNWHYVSAVFNRSSICGFYVDGKLIGSVNISSKQGSSVSNNSNLYIGNNNWYGQIDEVKIYDYARTEEEIRLDYNAGLATHLGSSGKTCSEDPAGCMDFGLAGHWDMDEGSGSVINDKSGNNNHGTLTNGPQWTKGKSGGALQFDGKNDYVDAGNNLTLQPASTVTLEYWMYPRKFSNGINERSVVGWRSIDKGIYTNLWNSYLYAQFWDGSAWQDIFFTLPSLNQWYHIVITYDASGGSNNYKIYSNGILKNQTTKIGNIVYTGGYFSIGNNTTIPFDGILDEIRLYNRALSAEEVRYHYNQGKPVGYWAMDEGSGAAIKDQSGNGNDGTISGATWTQGKHGSALSFDGVDDYAETTSFPSLRSNDFTMSAWINTNAPSVTQGIISDGSGTGSTDYSIRVHNGVIVFSTWDGASRELIGIKSIEAGTWYHIAVVWDKDMKKSIYVNGLLDTSTEEYVNITGDETGLRIGKFSYSYPHYFDGQIDEVKIYDYARTEEEIRLDYNAGLATHLGPSGKTCAEDPAGCMSYGLVGQWDMDEGGGTKLNDKSGNNNHGTLTNGPQWTKGKNGGALQFDGKNDYVNCGSGGSLSSSDALTIEAWIKPNTGYGQIYPRVIWKNYTASNGWEAFINSLTGKLKIRIYLDTGTLDSTYFNYILPQNQWTHVVITYDGNYVYGYFNGQKDAIIYNKTGIIQASSGDLRIGGISTRSFNGLIDDVKIYNRALSEAEVRYHYNHGGPVGYWDMDEGEGTRAFDVSGNNNTGVLTNGPTWVEGKHGSALSFDGVDDYVNAGNDKKIQITGSITISAWVKTNSVTTYNGIVTKYYIADGKRGYALEFNPYSPAGGGLRFILSNNGTAVTQVSTNQVLPNQWAYITGVYDGSSMELYVDGVLRESGSYSGGIYNTGENLFLGRSIGYASFNGLLDEVKIYNYARTEEQIMQDYNAGVATHLK